MVINSTPVRTCKNFRMNDIEFSEELPSKIEKFENVKIAQETGKDEVITDFLFEDFEVKYGTGLISEIKEQANQNIRININSKTDKEIKVEFDFDKENWNLIDNIEIVAKEDTTSNIYIIYRQRNTENAFHNGLIRVLAETNSKVIVNIVNLMSNESSNILSVDSKILDNASVKFNIIDFGGKTSVTNLYSNVFGKEASSSINSIYLGTGKETIDINYIAEMFGEKSKVDMEIQGALKDEAVKHFKGTIDFKKGCKKASGNEAENCMLLSDKAKSLALPMLLCSEEDVEGNHSASSGKADNKELFYIMTRGFDKKAAEKLLVRAKFNRILEGISNPEIKQEISYEIDRKLD
ncbi:MAG: SufD family Fe-S cluster assembly protein [Clostridia bacterium]|nr:SufD family Fe-S cluster assembly protein [Clostridia bacterium]